MTKPSDNEKRRTHRIGKVLPGYFGDVFSEEILQSPSFNNLCTYTLPSKLIEIVMRQQPGMLNSDQLAIEKQYEQFPEAVVFVRGVPKASKLIQNFDNQIDEDNFVKEFGRQAYDAVLKVLNDDVKKIDQIGKAYCGWLVQQRSYQDDIAELRAMLEERSDETASRCSKSICEKWPPTVFWPLLRLKFRNPSCRIYPRSTCTQRMRHLVRLSPSSPILFQFLVRGKWRSGLATRE